MASIQLYTGGYEQQTVSYSLAQANLLEAASGTHYTQNFLYKTANPTTQEDVWVVNLSIPLAGMDYLTVDKNYQPLPHYPLVDHSGHYYPAYVDPSATAISTRPSDWDIHWRDYYTRNSYVSWDGNLKRYYYANPLYPDSSGNAPTWETGTYYKTNQGRYVYWTLDGNYFPLSWGWFSINNTVYYGLQFGWAQYGKYNANWDAHWEQVNNPRFAGVSGPLVYGNDGEGADYFSFLHNYGSHTSLDGDIDPHVYFNFIGFKFMVADPQDPQSEPAEIEFIGLVAWEESIDGLPQRAQIVGLSKNFFGVRKKPANGGPISGIQGGNGSFSAPSDNRGDRNGTTAAGIASDWAGKAGIFSPGYNNYYLGSPDVAAFREMVENLWDPGIVDGFKNLMMDPVSAVVCCHQIPANLAPRSLGTPEVIKAAHMSLSTTTVSTFSDWMTYWHAGDIDISQYTDSFADYTNTAIYIHLPYIGTQLLDTAACMDGWLAVDYLTDVISGQCTALITTCDRFGNTQIRYEFKGDCSRTVDLHQRVPISTKVAAAAVPAAIGIAGAAASGAIVGSVAGSAGIALRSLSGRETGSSRSGGGFFGGAMYNAGTSLLNSYYQSGYNTVKNVAEATTSMATSATQAALSGAQTSSSNASGGDVSSPIDTQVWVMITRPQWSNPELYERERAYPSDISGIIGDFQGYLAVASAELNSIDCTDVERSEIMTRLSSGVLLS